MTDIKHDPELPYAIVAPDGELRARFSDATTAALWAEEPPVRYAVIDTTPVPPYKPESVLFRPGYVPVIRQQDGGWKVFYQGEPVG